MSLVQEQTYGRPAFEGSQRAATADEVLTAFARLAAAFDVYDDPSEDAKFALLTESVAGQPLWAIKRAVDDFAFGRIERKKHVLPKPWEFGPHVQRIVDGARLRAEVAGRPSAGAASGLYGYRPPRSRVSMRGLTKDEARELVYRGMNELGSIWCPGTYRDGADKGDLYDPDPNWLGPVLILREDKK